MKKLFLVLVFLSSIFLFQSCSSCERNLNRLYDVNVDLDNDGDKGDLSGDYNPSFKARQSYYAECVHCKCDLYEPISAGNSYCKNCAKNGHYQSLKVSHVVRYY